MQVTLINGHIINVTHSIHYSFICEISKMHDISQLVQKQEQTVLKKKKKVNKTIETNNQTLIRNKLCRPTYTQIDIRNDIGKE